MYDEDIENNGLRELIEKGREQGFITFADINDFLPEDVSDPDQLDEVIQTINDLGLQVVENAPEEGSEAMEAISQPVALNLLKMKWEPSNLKLAELLIP